MTKTVVTAPIVTALKKADDILGPDRVWFGDAKSQKDFLNIFYREAETLLELPEIEAIASYVAQEINNFLKERGFSIKIEELGRNQFATASVFDLMFEWLEVGKESVINLTDNRKYYNAVSLESFTLFKHPNHTHPVVELPTKSGDKVYITKLANPDNGNNGLNLVLQAKNLMNGLEPETESFSNVKFPMINWEETIQHEWLAGLQTVDKTNEGWSLQEVLQQTKLRINETGGRCQSAVAMSFRCLSVRLETVYEINEPFLLWYVRSGLKHPLFVAHLTKDSWNKPGKLR